jgi:hypothetical protein
LRCALVVRSRKNNRRPTGDFVQRIGPFRHPRGPAFAGAWNLDNIEAVSAVQWLIAKVVVAVENSESPIADACLIGGGQRVANLPIEAADRDGRPWSRSGDNAADLVESQRS